MKIVYIAHCIGAPTQEGIEENLADLRRVIRYINLTHPNVVPFAPYYADIVSMDDNISAERERGIRNDTAILMSGIVKELWLTGPCMSRGMHAEVTIANLKGIPVMDFINHF